MARLSSLLASSAPSSVASAEVTIGHVQLRDLIICPREPGLVNYVQNNFIVEHNLYAPDNNTAVRSIAELPFIPNTLASVQLPGSDSTLLAAGGQEAEIHLSLHQHSSRASRNEEQPTRPRHNSTVWQYYRKLHGSINNSVLLSSLSLTRSAQSSIEPRLVVSNNDCTVRFYDVAVRTESAPKDLWQSGNLKLEEPINHSSISPDGRTLLSVGDSPRIYLHHLTGGPYITSSPIITLNVPPLDAQFYSSSLSASFSTAFSHDGMKFAVASQEGIVAVWDVRSTKPIKVFQTDKTRQPIGSSGNREVLSDDPWDWTRGNSKAPGWGARSVKFGAGGTHGRPGHEVMTFTEHTSLLHVIDARTFETEEIVRIPSVVEREATRSTSSRPSVLSRVPSDGTHISATSLARQTAQPPRVIRTQAEESFYLNSFPNSIPFSTRRPSYRMSRRRNSEEGEEYNYGELSALPPVGDNAVQENIRETFSRPRRAARAYVTHRTDIYPQHLTRGSDSPSTYGNNDVDVDVGREDDSMDVDEPETDCISHAPSRSSSPPPSIHLPLQTSPAPSRSTALVRHTNARPFHSSRRTTTCTNSIVESTQNADQDIAGTCFDPLGGMIYVATTDSVSEWAVRGAEKRWWGCNAWA